MCSSACTTPQVHLPLGLLKFIISVATPMAPLTLASIPTILSDISRLLTEKLYGDLPEENKNWYNQ